MEQYKYRAFVSYSHADEKWGDWLQRALETYRVPEPLVGQATPLGPAPRRLTPIFRDRNDLPAAGSLNKAIAEALDASLFQIVICSPQVAKSRWVNEEIKRFKQKHGQDRLLAIIVDGEPGASAIPGREDEECFPPALRYRVDADGDITDEPAEPVAADARAEGDGRRMAVTKLAAGLVGVSLDALVRREAHRRVRQAQMIVGGSIAVVVAMGLLTAAAVNARFAAIDARNEEQAMRGRAENLVEFMLNDLRKQLEPVGKLDILKSVGVEALAYYEAQDLKKLDGDALNRRAKALLLMGNIHQRRHDFDQALKAYRAAAATTAEQLRRAPQDPERIFDHAQSVFYVGDVDIFRGNFEAGAPHYREYYRLAKRLVEIDASEPKWRNEMAYATSNLGILEFKQHKFDEAAQLFDSAIEMRRALRAEAPENDEFTRMLAYDFSWRAVNDLARGHYSSAIEALDEQASFYTKILADNDQDFQVIRLLALAYQRKGEALLARGEIAEAKKTWADNRELTYRLLDRDADDTLRLIYVVNSERNRAELSQIEGNFAEALEAADISLDFARRLYAVNPSDPNSVMALAKSSARRLELGGDEAAMRALAADIDNYVSAAMGEHSQYDEMIAIGLAALMRYERLKGDLERARDYAQSGAAYFRPILSRLSPPVKIQIIEFLMETGRADDARLLAESLDKLELKHPRYIELKKLLLTTNNK